MKVILLMVGEYSDAHVVGVFSADRREEAEQLADWIGGYVPDDEYEVDKVDFETPPKDMRFFRIEMGKHGEVFNEDYCEESVLGSGEYVGGVLGKRRKEGYRVTDFEYLLKRKGSWVRNHYKKNHWRLEVYTYAKDKQHAIKIANEKRTRILAGNLPKTNPEEWQKHLLSEEKNNG